MVLSSEPHLCHTGTYARNANTKGARLYAPYLRYTNRQATSIQAPLLRQARRYCEGPYNAGSASLTLPTEALCLFLSEPCLRSVDTLFLSSHTPLQAVIHRYLPVQMYLFQAVQAAVHFQELPPSRTYHNVPAESVHPSNADARIPSHAV